MGFWRPTLLAFWAVLLRAVKAMFSKGFWSWLAVIGAPLCLGAATGFLTGQTGPDSTVVAAVLPAVLTAGGAGVYAALAVNEFAAYEESRAAHEESLKARERQRKRYAEALDFRRQSLEQCSRNEALVNSGRRALGLAPLPSELFCDIGPVHPQ